MHISLPGKFKFSSEHYGNLLEAWLLRGKPEIIGEYRRP